MEKPLRRLPICGTSAVLNSQCGRLLAVRFDRPTDDGYGNIFQAVGFFRVESCPTQAVLPLVGLAADKVTRDRYRNDGGRITPGTAVRYPKT
ncbi:MAG: hypothetical protein ACQESR_16785 [Planctomycetota bacterium]